MDAELPSPEPENQDGYLGPTPGWGLLYFAAGFVLGNMSFLFPFGTTLLSREISHRHALVLLRLAIVLGCAAPLIGIGLVLFAGARDGTRWRHKALVYGLLLSIPVACWGWGFLID